ncbi:hypothetical protein HMPREF1210_01145 [Paenisporosarcina sp. HGH0030]|uniref:hypothetical protein n=1 Tax=Paenisporosarcina sp. HGH0030 TaxID=1078085 RepID=UPI00034E9F5A|nr:hypothetical protein [Paenisporosarcina sp. HGH0030]EPD52765.1 hypothetical protein HMPREF1210_01145 [Paenisporosarcina sp. HGH0030]
MYFKKETVTQVNFLASANFQSFTTQVEQAGVATDANGRKIVKAGTILPLNDATAKGILLTDVDVTTGPQPGALIVEGYILELRLPVAPAAAAKTALTKITFR